MDIKITKAQTDLILSNEFAGVLTELQEAMRKGRGGIASITSSQVDLLNAMLYRYHASNVEYLKSNLCDVAFCKGANNMIDRITQKIFDTRREAQKVAKAEIDRRTF